MKTAIFTWLLLLPIQIYAAGYNSRLSEGQVPRITHQEEAISSTEVENLVIASNSEQIGQKANFQAITVSQEKDIQKLKSQLAHKNHEIYTQELNQWKFQSATLIFFVGMMFFAFLYIRGKLSTSKPEVVTLSNLYSQEK